MVGIRYTHRLRLKCMAGTGIFRSSEIEVLGIARNEDKHRTLADTVNESHGLSQEHPVWSKPETPVFQDSSPTGRRLDRLSSY